MSNRFVYLLQKYSLFRLFILSIFFLVIGVCVLQIRSFLKVVPVILEVNPTVFDKNGTVTIIGKYFGEEAEDSFLKVENIMIPSTLCNEWGDEKIVLSSSLINDGGLLFVIAKNSYSKPVFISSILDIPIVKKQENIESKPSIEALSKDYGEIGSLIKIYGNNFGSIRENSNVIFIRKTMLTQNSHNDDFVLLPNERDIENIAYCSERDFDFDFWSDEEIHIRIPDGADSGLIAIETKNGISNVIPFNIRGKIGTKSFQHKEEFLISMETEVSNVNGEKNNILFLRSPLPELTNSQTNIKMVFNAPPPLIQNNEEVIYQFDDIKKDDKISVKQQYKVTTCEIKTKINVGNVSLKINNQRLHDYYTRETNLLPISSNIQLKTLANTIIGNERNPYIKAKKIYDYIIANFNISIETAIDKSQTVLSMLENKTGSPYDASLLFSALCRLVDVPSMPISGIITDGIKTYLHWWTEFYIDSYGWIPLDIGMAIGIPFTSKIENKKDYYFGNLDGNRVSFSHGEKEILAMTAEGKTYTKERNFALQSFWEEAFNISSYTCFWHVPQINKIN
ncbi:MAG: transglutaminase-like domain-containing protein [Treponema sp.]